MTQSLTLKITLVQLYKYIRYKVIPQKPARTVPYTLDGMLEVSSITVCSKAWA